jgi:hypothetical protein
MTKRKDRPRRRSKRRSLYCPEHGCYLDSCSIKYYLYLDRENQLRVRGLSSLKAKQVIQEYKIVPLRNEWLEELWCVECQTKKWYHIRRDERSNYSILVAPNSLWRQVSGVTDPSGNPSVSEFTRVHSRALNVHGLQTYRFL